MHNRLKKYVLVICLFVFLFVIIGGGLHLATGGAFVAALTGTPLAIFAFQSRFGQGLLHANGRPSTAKK